MPLAYWHTTLLFGGVDGGSLMWLTQAGLVLTQLIFYQGEWLDKDDWFGLSSWHRSCFNKEKKTPTPLKLIYSCFSFLWTTSIYIELRRVPSIGVFLFFFWGGGCRILFTIQLRTLQLPKYCLFLWHSLYKCSLVIVHYSFIKMYISNCSLFVCYT